MKIKILIVMTLLLGILLLLYFVFTPNYQTKPSVIPSPYVWDVAMENIVYITINLPPEGKSEADFFR